MTDEPLSRPPTVVRGRDPLPSAEIKRRALVLENLLPTHARECRVDSVTVVERHIVHVVKLHRLPRLFHITTVHVRIVAVVALAIVLAWALPRRDADAVAAAEFPLVYAEPSLECDGAVPCPNALFAALRHHVRLAVETRSEDASARALSAAHVGSRACAFVLLERDNATFSEFRNATLVGSTAPSLDTVSEERDVFCAIDVPARFLRPRSVTLEYDGVTGLVEIRRLDGAQAAAALHALDVLEGRRVCV